jgi:hypothetical protein
MTKGSFDIKSFVIYLAFACLPQAGILKFGILMGG